MLRNAGAVADDFTLDKAGQHVRERLQGFGNSKHLVCFRHGWRIDRQRRSTCLPASRCRQQLRRLFQQHPFIREVGCWAHARRKFFEVAKVAPDSTPTATGALVRINALFDVERIASEEGISLSARQARRAEQARSILDALDQLPNHWNALTRYLDDGHCVIDNNDAERALRVVAIGRNYGKLWIMQSVVSRTDSGARRAGAAGTCPKTSTLHNYSASRNASKRSGTL